mgnify:CR=1 FL=1
MNLLKILLPNKLPTAISTEPILIAEMQTTNSGRDVEIAINKVAKMVFSIPECPERKFPK